jgi:stalled ribosome alternative rescue factor ArfA
MQSTSYNRNNDESNKENWNKQTNTFSTFFISCIYNK